MLVLCLFQAGLPTMEECQKKADSYHKKDDLWESVKYYLLSAHPETGVEIGLQYVKGMKTLFLVATGLSSQ